MATQLDIRHLRLLTAIAETGSVTGAGDRLFLTQSALSHQLRDAEDKLGAQLFLRLGKKMVLTAAGERLLQSAERILTELETAEEQVAALNGGGRGTIRLSTQCYTCYHWLPAILKKFHAKFPKVDVSIDAEATPQPDQWLLRGKLDVAIMNCPPRNRSLRLRPMFDDEIVLVISPEHHLARLHHVQPRDLAEETILNYPPKEDSTLINRVLLPAGVSPKRVIEVPLTEAIIEMAAAGTGVGFLARWAVSPDVERGRVITRSVTSRGFRRKWWCVTLKSSSEKPYLEDFVELLQGFRPKHAKAA
jgi:LysR family transcriptional regulator for metE and metH